MTTTIRVLLLDVPPLLREILEHAFAEQRDIEPVSHDSEPPVDPRVVGLLPDVVITADGDDLGPRSAAALLKRWPRAHVLTVRANGRDAVLYDLRPHRTRLGRLSPADAIKIIRTVARGPG